MNDVKQAYKYVDDILEGNIKAGILTIQACERFKRDIEDSRFYFNEEKVNHCLSFLNLLKHYTGKSAGKQFILSDWQVFITANIVGFYWNNSNERRFTQSYIEVARKNGKSFFAGALCLYFLIADGEASAEVLLLANSRQQAKDIDFAVIAALSKQLDSKQRYIKQYRDYVNIPSTESKLKVLAAEAKTGDGYNCSFGLIDEYHEATDNKMKDLIVSSQGMRLSPHCCIITTAGFDTNKPCYKLRNYCCEILSRVKEDESQFTLIYELDIDDDYCDESNWIKANPCLGQTVTTKYIREQVNKAKNNPSDEVGVKTKTLNIWCKAATIWIPESIILKHSRRINNEEFKDEVIYIGIDLAATSDFTALSILKVKDSIYSFKTKYYLPEEALKTKADKELYKLWVKAGYLTITSGNVTDYDYVLNDIMMLSKEAYIEGVYYDKWNCTQFANSAVANGINMVEFGQNLANFNRPTKEFERLILSGNIELDDNEINRFCFENVVIKSDWNGNIKPDKSINKKKIDGVISKLMALGGYLSNIQYNNYNL